MASPQRKSLDEPEETRPIEMGKVEIVKLDTGAVMRTTFDPGWRWSEHVKPIVGGDSCQVDHIGYCVSGRLHAVMDDGEEIEFKAGDAVHLPPGHDAWVEGDEPYVGLDFQGADIYAKPQ